MKGVVIARLLSRVAWPVFMTGAQLSASSCHARPDSITPERLAAYQVALAQYQRDSVDWARSKIVRDSISRTINTDSLYHLYHAMLLAPDPVPIKSLINCEGFRLGWRYGSAATLAAWSRMADTIWTPSERKLMRQRDAHFGGLTVDQMATLGTSIKRCGPMGPHQPEVVDGVRIDVEETRPVRPMKP